MPKTELCIGAVIIEDDKILLVKREHKPAKGMWAIPGGRVEDGETLIDAVKREMFEECNIKVEVGNPVCVAEVIRENKHYVIIDFYAKIKDGNLKAGDDALDFRWFPLDEVANRDDVVESTKEFCLKLANLKESSKDCGCRYIPEILI